MIAKRNEKASQVMVSIDANSGRASNIARNADWPFLSKEGSVEPSIPSNIHVAAYPPCLHVAANIQRLCEVRKELFEGLIHDAPFNILLDLFIRETRHQKVTVGDAAIASAAPQTTALRAIQGLIEAGHVISLGDPHDSRRKLLHLTPKSKHAIQNFLGKAERLLTDKT